MDILKDLTVSKETRLNGGICRGRSAGRDKVRSSKVQLQQWGSFQYAFSKYLMSISRCVQSRFRMQSEQDQKEVPI
jgi:hypothetical protein